MSRVFGRGRKDPLLLGSVKTNVGHSEAASGIASIIKASIMLETARIPPTHGLRKINPNIKTDEWNVRVVTRNESWPGGSLRQPRRVSINSVGHLCVSESTHSNDSLCSLAMAAQMPMRCWRTLTASHLMSKALSFRISKMTGHTFCLSLQRLRMDF